jgi:chaperonin GroES
VKYTPYGSKVLVRPDADEAVTAGGIVVPDSAKVSAKFGTIVAIGKRVTQVEKGNRVCFPWATGDQISFGSAGQHVEMDQDELFGVVD